MKLEVGMYVRTKRGQIGKIITIGKDNVAIEFNKMWQDIIHKENIIKASFNIIDLIEAGDYINGHRVIFVNDTFTYASVNVETSGEATCEIIPKNNIKSIVTKEQFEQMSYKIEV